MREILKSLVVLAGLLPSIGDAAETPDVTKPAAATATGDRLGEMITIPAGSFLMGNNGNEPFSSDAELPQHRVDLPTYEIGKYEVTRGEYRRFMEAGGYDDSRYWYKSYPGAQQPVERTGEHRFARVRVRG